MFPFAPSFPSLRNQIQTHTHAAKDSIQQKVNVSNLGSNPSNPFPCPPCIHQIPSQLLINNQFPIPTMAPFNNINPHMNNLPGNCMPMPNGPPSIPVPCFPNQIMSSQPQGQFCNMPQNLNHMASALPNAQFCYVLPNLNQMAAVQQQGQFLLQNHSQNAKQIMPARCLQAQNLNQNMPLQPRGQFCGHNLPHNPNQFFNLPNGEICSQNPVQNLNQNMPAQCLQHSHSAMVHPIPFNICPNYHPSFASPNKIPSAPGSQNPNVAMNPTLGVANSNVNPNNAILTEPIKYNSQNPAMFSPLIVGQNTIQESSVAAANSQGSLFPSLAHGPAQMIQLQENLQPTGLQQSQGNSVQVRNISHGNAEKNFTRNLNGSGRFQKYQSPNMSKAKGKFRLTANNLGKGNHNRADKAHPATPNEKAGAELKRSIPWVYTEQEIQQWLEERKKNYPSRAKIEEKLAKRHAKNNISDEDAKRRRQQLKEILVKQAELGIEVAEIPPKYFSDSENQAPERGDGKIAHNFRKGRFCNKFDKRQDCNKFDKRQDHHSGSGNRRSKKRKFGQDETYQTSVVNKRNQKFGQHETSQPSIVNKRNQTLLEKLLSADIKRDKSRLLQVFRFMVLNSFFEDWPQKPLEFPWITVKDAMSNNEFVERNSLHGGDDHAVVGNTVKEEIKHQRQDRSVVEESTDENKDDHDSKYFSGKGSLREQNEKSEGEEGEITD